MSYDLTNQNISDTFQNLLQKTGSNNQLYDLQGNQIIDLTIAGALHAQSYIVSQSVSNLVVTSGSTVFGDSIDDTHNFNGKISASGQIHTLVNNSIGHFPRLELNNNGGNNALAAPCIEFGSGSTSGDGLIQMVGVLRDTLPFVGSGGGPKLVFRSGSIQTNGDKNAFVLDFIEPTTKLILDGHITASGNISASGTSHTFGGNTFVGSLTIGAPDAQGFGFTQGGGGSISLHQADDDGVSFFEVNSGDSQLRTENFQNAVYVDDSTQGVGIGTSVPTKKLQVAGDISASGFIFLKETGSAFQGVDGAGAGYLFASSSGQLCYQSGSTEASVIALGTGGGGGGGTITALNNQAQSRLVTIGSTTTELDGEANLTYDGTTFTVNDDMQVSSGKLTVDGEITSSEAIFAKGTELDFSISASANTHLIISGANNEVMVGTENASGKLLTVHGDISASGNFITQGHITSSGNISASGTQHKLSGTLFVDRIDRTDDINKGIRFGDGVNSDSHITASGNISASGNFMGNNMGEISADFIPIVPSDFHMSLDSSRGHTIYTDTNAGSAKAVFGNTPVCIKIIPKGFTAISGSLYGSDTSNVATWYSSSITLGTSATVSTDVVEAASGTGSAFTNAVTGDGVTYVACKWMAGSSDQIYGGKIYLEKT